MCLVLRRRMWMLLQVHAKQCQRSDCPVPRCKELREMRRRAVVRQEDQRRVAYKNMVCMPILALYLSCEASSPSCSHVKHAHSDWAKEDSLVSCDRPCKVMCIR